jgi:(p)ppGpp synthase/HD superfamily hydrolase
MENKLDLVKELATKLHGEQKRKYSGEPYVTHTFRVAKTVEEHGGDENMVYAALLHDVLEDTETTEVELFSMLSNIIGHKDSVDTVRMVKELTDVFTTEKYPDINRVGRKEMESFRLGMVSKRSQTIKYADLLDNGVDILKNDPKFAKVYLKEKRMIMDNMDKGNQTLYKKCMEFLNL